MQYYKKHDGVYGRYLPYELAQDIFVHKIFDSNPAQKTGTSVNNKYIQLFTIGTGCIKVLMWSQMHGNESTTTKALIDLLLFLKTRHIDALKILKNTTLYIIPQLNPDGATMYTRENANGVDLNRDAQKLSQPESVFLRTCFEEVKPHYCFNLHDQRSIFSAGNNPKPATISFLAPTADEARTITNPRKAAMYIITKVHINLQLYINGQISRFDDTHNINCVGDTFVNHSVPTLLFEAGHYPNDYQRETTRYYMFLSLVTALLNVDRYNDNEDYKDYFNIPENQKLFFDLKFTNVLSTNNALISIGVLYKEVLTNGLIQFIPVIEQIDLPKGYFGHECIDFQGKTLDELKAYLRTRVFN